MVKIMGLTLFLEMDDFGEETTHHLRKHPYHLPKGLIIISYIIKTGGPEIWNSPYNYPLYKLYTPWKINMEPKNDGLEDDFPFQLGGF